MAENNQSQADPQHGQPQGQQHHAAEMPPPPKISRSVVKLVVVILVIVAIVVVAIGILGRLHSDKNLAKYTDANAAPTVNIAPLQMQATSNEIVLPGNMQAFAQAPLYARTTGYVRSWTHDIGSHVRRGDVLAVIETPELDQQLAQAKADLAVTKNNAGLAKATADRYRDLVGRNAVSQQDTDNAVNQFNAQNNQVIAAEANVRRLAELQSFEKITAPFDGVVTARNLDVGQLITANGGTTSAGAGTTTSNKQVFDIAKIDKLRVFVNVPQVYAPDARNGVAATLTLPQYPGRKFHGTLVRTSNAVDPATRTLLAEVDVDNPTGELLPGSYTEVHLNVSNPVPVRLVPVSALILQTNGVAVATVDENSHVHFVRIVLGRDFGENAEIVSGLKQNDKVISNPADSITDGETVRVVKVGQDDKDSGPEKKHE